MSGERSLFDEAEITGSPVGESEAAMVARTTRSGPNQKHGKPLFTVILRPVTLRVVHRRHIDMAGTSFGSGMGAMV